VRSLLGLDREAQGRAFEARRRRYPLRREPTHRLIPTTLPEDRSLWASVSASIRALGYEVAGPPPAE
jgi:hypothetical protein